MPRSPPGPVISWPSRIREPSVGSSSPATMRSTVDLPQPDGPSRAQSSFSATSKETSTTASMTSPEDVPKDLETCDTESFAPSPVRVSPVPRITRPKGCYWP